jgi:hypothetical protein
LTSLKKHSRYKHSSLFHHKVIDELNEFYNFDPPRANVVKLFTSYECS